MNNLTLKYGQSHSSRGCPDRRTMTIQQDRSRFLLPRPNHENVTTASPMTSPLILVM